MANRDHHLNLNYLPTITSSQPKSGSSTANTSPIETPVSTSAVGGARSPFGLPPSVRLGSASPSHEIGGRLYSKRYVILVT
jgi:protein JSN1